MCVGILIQTLSLQKQGCHLMTYAHGHVKLICLQMVRNLAKFNRTSQRNSARKQQAVKLN
jgi:hypothetical protein